MPSLLPAVNLRRIYDTNWALITGANSGLGRHLSHLIAAQGLNIIGVGLEADQLESTKQECESHNIEFIPVATDLSDLESIPKVLSVCDGRDIGVVFLNAGYGPFGRVAQMSDSKIQSYLNLMCTSYAILCREFLCRHFLRKRPSLIYITASLAADYTVPLQALYCAAKSYLSRFGAGVACECAGSNAGITVLHPGCF
jgi:short-subunit dehydrogenase